MAAIFFFYIFIATPQGNRNRSLGFKENALAIVFCKLCSYGRLKAGCIAFQYRL